MAQRVSKPAAEVPVRLDPKRHFITAIVLCVSIAVLAFGARTAPAQELTGTVTQDPNAGTVTYTFAVNAPPGGLGILSFLLPVFPDRVFPGSIFAPLGWSAQFVNPSDPLYYWDYIPLADPKFVAGNYGPDPNIWIDPPALLFQAGPLIIGQDDRGPIFGQPPVVQPGQSLGGFGFRSPFLPINAPSLFQDSGLNVFVTDPSVPGPTLIDAPEPGTLGLALLGLLALTAARRRRTADSATR